LLLLLLCPPCALLLKYPQHRLMLMSRVFVQRLASDEPASAFNTTSLLRPLSECSAEEHLHLSVETLTAERALWTQKFNECEAHRLDHLQSSNKCVTSHTALQRELEVMTAERGASIRELAKLEEKYDALHKIYENSTSEWNDSYLDLIVLQERHDVLHQKHVALAYERNNAFEDLTKVLLTKFEALTSGDLPKLAASVASAASTSEASVQKLTAQFENVYMKSATQLEEKLSKLEQRLSIAEILIAQQDNRIETLSTENERLKRASATQDSVDDLRKVLQDLQMSMISQSSKVIDLIVANLSGKKD